MDPFAQISWILSESMMLKEQAVEGLALSRKVVVMHNIILTVRDFKRSFAFYECLRQPWPPVLYTAFTACKAGVLLRPLRRRCVGPLMALLRRPLARAELTGAGACGQDFYTAGGQRKNPTTRGLYPGPTKTAC